MKRLHPRSRPASALTLLLASLSLGWNPLQRTVSEVEQGNTLLAQGDPEGALELYRAAAEQIPTSPELHYNMGLAQLASEQLDDAVASLKQAISTPDTALRAKTFAALGHSHAKKEAWEEAVASFKRALLLHPSDDLRHNYELAWLKLHPPCSAREDAYEDNDSPEQAKALDPQIQGPLTACPGDDDWFVIEAPEAHGLFVTVRSETEGAAVHAALIDPSGHTIREAANDAGVTRLDLRQPERPGLYRVRVWETGEVEAAYTLEMMALPPCPGGDDGLEDNDSREQASAVEKGQQALRICPNDEDWIKVTVAAEADLAVSIQYDPPRGQLALELWDEAGEEALEISQSGQGKETLARKKPGEGSWWLRVRGAGPNAHNVYMLQVSDEAPDPESQPNQDQDQDQDQEKKEEEKKEEEKKEEEKKEEEKKEEEKKEEEKKEEQQPPSETERQRIEELLRSLEQDERNLALEKALQQATPRRVKKDW